MLSHERESWGSYLVHSRGNVSPEIFWHLRPMSLLRDNSWNICTQFFFPFLPNRQSFFKEMFTFVASNFCLLVILQFGAIWVLPSWLPLSNSGSLLPDLISFGLLAVLDTLEHSFLSKAFSCSGFYFTCFWFFSSYVSGWLFSASFGVSFLFLSLKHWCSPGGPLRSSFLHTPHTWWFVLSTPWFHYCLFADNS